MDEADEVLPVNFGDEPSDLMFALHIDLLRIEEHVEEVSVVS